MPSIPTIPGPVAHPSRPTIRIPRHACDAHCHLFGPNSRYPFVDDRPYTPPDAGIDDYRRLQGILGFERAIFVQPACHGDDHRAVLDAIGAYPKQFRGVGLVGEGTSDKALAELHTGGFRGARFNMTGKLGSVPNAAEILTVARRVAPLGWHIVFHVAGNGILALTDIVRELPCPFVIDHMGRIDLSAGFDGDAACALFAMAADPRGWIKISGADRLSLAGPPFEDAMPLMHRLADASGGRLLWGTDWPHPNVSIMPDDGKLVDLFGLAFPDEALRTQILVDNPARLYGFGDD